MSDQELLQLLLQQPIPPQQQEPEPLQEVEQAASHFIDPSIVREIAVDFDHLHDSLMPTELLTFVSKFKKRTVPMEFSAAMTQQALLEHLASIVGLDVTDLAFTVRAFNETDHVDARTRNSVSVKRMREIGFVVDPTERPISEHEQLWELGRIIIFARCSQCRRFPYIECGETAEDPRAALKSSCHQCETHFRVRF